MQGGQALDGDLRNVERLASLGVRMLALAHVMDSPLAGSGTGSEGGGVVGAALVGGGEPVAIPPVDALADAPPVLQIGFGCIGNVDYLVRRQQAHQHGGDAPHEPAAHPAAGFGDVRRVRLQRLRQIEAQQ